MDAAGDLYLLDAERRVVPCHDFAEWCQKRMVNSRVGYDKIGGFIVSTVFIGLDKGFGFGRAPLVFETMIFGGPQHGWQQHSTTWQDAESVHKVACDLVKEGWGR